MSTRSEYLDYNNQDHPYIPERDPREINIAQHIEEIGQTEPSICTEECDVTTRDVAIAIQKQTTNKLDKNLGSENSGKFLVINERGEITPTSLSTWESGEY